MYSVHHLLFILVCIYHDLDLFLMDYFFPWFLESDVYEEDEPEEVKRAWEELVLIQREQQR